jgi:hypothetical protein
MVWYSTRKRKMKTAIRINAEEKIEQARLEGRLYFTNGAFYYIRPTGTDDIHIIDMSQDIPTVEVCSGEWAVNYIANNQHSGAFYRDKVEKVLS